MPDPANNPISDEETRAAALRAGWDGQGPNPSGHGLPPEVDDELSHNGVPAPVPGDADYVELETA